MLKRQFAAVFVVVLALLSGIGLFAAGLGTLAHEGDSCATPTADSPFLGMSDPNAPYDLRFIDEMVMHHRGAVISADMMVADSEHPELLDLAQRIQEDQQQQIEQMLAWRAEWYPDAATPSMSMDSGEGSMRGMMDGGMMGDMMDGGMMRDMMDGEMTDRMFLRMMIPHHQLAIEMAEDALVNAEHEELKALAQEIIDGQSAEIAEMEGYLRDWYDEASTRDAASDMHEVMQRMMGEC